MTDPPPPRVHLVQHFLGRFDQPRYLEIGVDRGGSLLAIKAAAKTGVDPDYHLSAPLMTRYALRNRKTNLHRMTSDTFFKERAAEVLGDGVDVVFIDGLHTYGQSLRDVCNALEYLNSGGFIVMHDCLPPHAAAATPAPSYQAAQEMRVPGWNGEWTGDVYKTMVHLRAGFPDLQAFVFDRDYGLGVVQKGKPSSILDLPPEQIRNLTYEDLMQNREKLLGLKPTAELDRLLESTR